MIDREKNKIRGCPKCGGIPVLESSIIASRIHCSNGCGTFVFADSKQDAAELVEKLIKSERIT
jgi:hypothetical protein